MGIAIIIGGGSYYYNMVLWPQLEMVTTLKSQNKDKKVELQSLQQELERLSERESELRQIQATIQVLKNKVPNYDTTALMMVEIIQYMEIHQFKDLDIYMGQPEKQEDKENQQSPYYKVLVTMGYVSTYDETISLLEKINRSDQIITVDYLSLSSGSEEQIDQEQTNQEGYKTFSGDSIKTELVLGLYYTDSK